MAIQVTWVGSCAYVFISVPTYRFHYSEVQNEDKCGDSISLQAQNKMENTCIIYQHTIRSIMIQVTCDRSCTCVHNSFPLDFSMI